MAVAVDPEKPGHVDPERIKHKLQIVGKVGRGAFGTVYRGTFDGRLVAVKVLTTEGDRDSDANRMFFKEAHVLQKLNHKNIVRFIALCKLTAQLPGLKGSQKGRWALVEEYLKDGTLSRKICTQMANPTTSCYSDEQALEWSLDVARALCFLHMCNPPIIHRDVKHGNVLLTHEDGRLTAKLVDFGLHVVADGTRERLFRMHSEAPLVEKYDSVFFRPGDALPPQPAQPPQQVLPSMRENVQAEEEEQQQQQQKQLQREQSQQLHYLPVLPMANIVPSQGNEGIHRQLTFTDDSVDSAADVSARSNGVLHSNGGLHSNDASVGLRSATLDGSSGSGRHGRRAPKTRSCFRYYAESSLGDSVCSFATDVTMAGNASVVSDSDLQELGEFELQQVYALTGQTGSCMYMAPEVFKGEPYNEKADVFSFAIILYELFSRSMLVFTELPVGTTDPSAPDRYADNVADGYRPRKAPRIHAEVWQLIIDCWHHDPLERPDMPEVVERLELLLECQRAGELEPASGSRASKAGGCCVVM